jgi:flagellar assembly protein FliH
MSSYPDRSRSSSARVLRAVDERDVRLAEIVAVEALPYTMDGQPITAELRDAKDAGFRKGWDSGWQEGHEHGYNAGRHEAYAEFTSVLGPTIEAMEAVKSHLHREERATLEQLEHQIVDFAFEVVQALLGRVLAEAEAPARDRLVAALHFVPDRGTVSARLHPDDATILGAVDHLLPGRSIEVVADPSVERGGAIVEVGACRIDGQISFALARIRSVLGLAED